MRPIIDELRSVQQRQTMHGMRASRRPAHIGSRKEELEREKRGAWRSRSAVRFGSARRARGHGKTAVTSISTRARSSISATT